MYSIRMFRSTLYSRWRNNLRLEQFLRGAQNVTLGARGLHHTNLASRCNTCCISSYNKIPHVDSNTVFRYAVSSKLIVPRYQHQCMSSFQKRFYSETHSGDGDKSSPVKDNDQESVGNVSGQLCIVFTCKVCQTRSSKMFTRLSYENGIVIVQCPGCKSNHLIADNLGWFDHIEQRNIEEILASKGESVKRVTDSLGTMEVTVEDVLHIAGSAAGVKSITDGKTDT